MLRLPAKYSHPFGLPNARPLLNFKPSDDFPLDKLIAYFGFESRVNRLRDIKTGLFLPQTLTGTSAWDGDGFRFDLGRFSLTTSEFNIGADFIFLLSFKTTETSGSFKHVISCRTSASSGDNYSIELKSGLLYLWQTHSGGTFRAQKTDNTINDGQIKNVVISRENGQPPVFYINGILEPSSLEFGSWTAGASDTSTLMAIGGAGYSASDSVSNTTIRSFAAFNARLPNGQELSRDIYKILQPINQLIYFPSAAAASTASLLLMQQSFRQ